MPFGRIPGNFSSIFKFFISLWMLFSTPGYCTFIASSYINQKVRLLQSKHLYGLALLMQQRRASFRMILVFASNHYLGTILKPPRLMTMAWRVLFPLPFQRPFWLEQVWGCLLGCWAFGPLLEELLAFCIVIQWFYVRLANKLTSNYHIRLCGQERLPLQSPASIFQACRIRKFYQNDLISPCFTCSMTFRGCFHSSSFISTSHKYYYLRLLQEYMKFSMADRFWFKLSFLALQNLLLLEFWKY